MQFIKIFKKRFFCVIIIFLTSLLTYAISLNNQFLWDDEIQIIGNTVIHNLKNLPLLFTQGIVYTQGQALSGGFYRPILTLTYMLLWQISNTSFTFRLFQITIHAINSVLVYLIFNLILTKESKIQSIKKISFMSFVGGLIFAIHPGISEGVLFIAGLGEPLFTFFILTAFLLFLKQKYFPSGLIYLFALLTKETAVSFLPIVLLYSLLFVKKKQEYKKIIIFFVIFLIYFILRYSVVGTSVTELKFPAPIAQAPLVSRLLTIPYEISFYLALFVFPYKLSISQHKVVYNFSNFYFWGPLLLLACLCLTLYLFYRKTRLKLFLFFFCLFLFGLLPALNLIPLASTVAERWLYFPIIGSIGSLLIILENLVSKLKINWKIPILLLTIWLIFLAIRTFLRTLDWQNGMSLYHQDIKINPESFELQNNYGVELFRKGEFNLAKIYFEKSVKSAPNWWTNYNNLGVIYEKEGDFNKAKAYYQKAIDNGNYFLAYENMANLLLKSKNWQEIIEFSRKNLPYLPQSVVLHKAYAIALYQMGNWEEALKEAKITLSLKKTAENLSLFNLILNRQTLP